MTAPARAPQLSPLAAPPAPSDDKLLLGEARANGFQRPLARDQLASWFGHGLSAALFYGAAVALLLTSDERGLVTLTLVALALHIPTFALLVAAWVSCERIDPSRDVTETLPNGWLGIKLGGGRWEKARYCALCRKNVPGLDHHCTWLQTCIGKANYVQFFTIACTGSLQFLAQTLYAALCLAWLYLPSEHAGLTSAAIRGVLAACLLVSGPCTVMYFILLGFHLWLTWLGFGTYEWMLRRRRQKSAARKARDEMRKRKQLSGSSDDTATDGSGSEADAKGRPAVDSVASPDSRRHTSSVGSESHFVNAGAGGDSSRSLTSL